MRVSDVQLTKLCVPYRTVRSSSWTVRRGSPIGLVSITDSDGVVGYGDYLARPNFAYGEAVLKHAVDQIKGMDVHDSEAILNQILAASGWALKGELSYSAAAVVAAIDVALWDIRAKRAGVPLYKLLGGLTNRRIRPTYQVSSGPPEATERDVQEAARLGVEALSVKLAKANHSSAEDIDTVRRIRTLAPKSSLSIDINHAWTVGTAVRTLAELEKYDILFCESPTRGIGNLRDIRQRTRIPIAADEAAWSLERILRIVEAGAADIVLIDLPALGGITNALKALGILEAANIPAVVHGNGEIVTQRAAYHLAFAKRPFGAYPHQFYFELEDGPFPPFGKPSASSYEIILPSAPGITPVDSGALHGYADDGRPWVESSGGPAPYFPKY